MTDSLNYLLGNKKYQEPEEISQIKKFVFEKFAETPHVEINKNSIIITVDSGALATSLRYKILELQSIVKTDKKLIIRIK
ncbi:hypothetical protein A3F37_03855 [Candidatus Saccharibacteria bacterium RIFCSPHIGHO2_12_FULL_41_12]|nr:MAG: hypothetical protein A3F37_03855 [Candidatus Saccharibacteria bacterium RIFCSPHIGHO2_12_FULL_41_12]